MLYTTKQIAEMYSNEENTVSSYMITQTWIPKGLKHIRGRGNSYLFKIEWVDEFLEGEALNQVSSNYSKVKKSYISKCKTRDKINIKCQVH